MDMIWSAVVGTRNTPNLIKHFVERWKKVVPDGKHHLIIVDSGGDASTEMLLQDETFNNIHYYIIKEDMTLSDTYNFGVRVSPTDYISFLHNDIWLPDGYFNSLSESFEDDKICITRRIEPIIFANSRTNDCVKYMDCGTTWESIDEDKIYKSMNIVQDAYGHQHFNFFISFHKNSFTEIGGMDNLFDPMFCEDDDIHKRWCMIGRKFKLMGKVQFYHMPSQTSRYSEEYKYKTKKIEDVSNKNFFRKWGSKNKNITIPKIPNALITTYDDDKKFKDQMLLDEIFFSYIICINNNPDLDEIIKSKIQEWYTHEQKYTQLDLSNKIILIRSNELNSIISEKNIIYSVVYKKSINLNKLITLDELAVNNKNKGRYMVDDSNMMIIHQDVNVDNLPKNIQIDRSNRIDKDLWRTLKKERIWNKAFSD